MHCKLIQAQLHDYIDKALSEETRQAIDAHLHECQCCRNELQELQALLAQLNQLPVPAPSADFEDHVLHALQAPTTHRRGFFAGFSSAIAASLMLGLLVYFMMFKPATDIEEISIALVPEQLEKVNVVFRSPSAFEQATLIIELPENVELAGYPGQRRLQWQTRIQQGSNRLRLPLILHGDKNARIVTRISQGKQHKTFHLDVKAGQRPAVYLEHAPQTLT